MEYLNEDLKKKKKKGQILYIAGRDNQITTSAKVLDSLRCYECRILNSAVRY